MKLSAQEEYGLRCLLQVARRAPDDGHAPLSIREVADAEGLSIDYAAKLLRILRQANLLDSERGATGGYRLARAPAQIRMAQVMRVLDAPLYSAEFCEGHSGTRESCVHKGGCSLRPLWQVVEAAVFRVLTGVTLADLLGDEPIVGRRLDEILGTGASADVSGGEPWQGAK